MTGNRVALAVAIAMLTGTAAIAQSGTANAWSPTQSAAYCLGQTEASLTYLVEVINRSAGYPTFDREPLTRSAAVKLAVIQKLARYIADRRATIDEDEMWALLQARQYGIHSINQCYRDQVATYIPCQTKCQEQSPEPSGQELCVDKCELPKSCTAPHPVACQDFEASLSNP